MQTFCSRYVFFSVISDIQSSAATLRNGLILIIGLFNGKWFLTLIWLSKRKRWYSLEKLRNCFTLVFSLMTLLKNSVSQRHLWLTLDVKVNFVDHIKNVTQKISKILSLLRRFQPILPRSSLLTTYKTFIRS